MPSAIMQEVVKLIEADVQSRPTPFEFELAYQARIAIDRIRFAIKQTEQAGGRAEQLREAGMQLLLDALARLESVERLFQQRSRCIPPDRKKHPKEPTNGNEMPRSVK
jgi:hypothetical protein